MSGMGGGLPVADSSVNIESLVARVEVFLCVEEGGQGEGKRCGLSCSACFRTLILHQHL